ncbi:MAG: ribonuclease HII [Deltaproteobacteria bacterium]|nr:ribonuclease HII [Deltaproteobacteria bacterium]
MGINVWHYENAARRQGHTRVAGIDEAGRGPLAGPVVAAAVVLPIDFEISGVTDSKRLSPRTRDRLYDDIYSHAESVGIGIVDPAEIDRINILKASLAAMSIAVRNLSPIPDFLLIDGLFTISSKLPQQAIVRGDSASISISAASIVAKVTRDRIMEGYGMDYPEYGFHRHKGYPTKAHKEAIACFGPCLIHRRSFSGVLKDDALVKSQTTR